MQKIRANPFYQLHQLGRKRQLLLLRAAVVLVAASATVALMPFRRAIGFGNVRLADEADIPRAEDYVWAVEMVASRVPFRAACIEMGLAVQRLLRQRGVDARLHYGARIDPVTAALDAHVWVTVDGVPVIGGTEAAEFAEIAIFP